MDKIGRNDPCPCGSGKKYKKCCMMRDQESEIRDREESEAASRALDWLAEHYPDETDEAVHGEFFGGLTDEEMDRLGNLPDDLQDMIQINIGEWLVTDAHIEVNGVRTPVRDLFFGLGGPLMSPASRDWLQRLGERPLSLYEVQEVKPREGMELADLLKPDGPSVWVTERTATRNLLRYDVLGARLVRRDGGFVLSGAVYPFIRTDALACRDKILNKIKRTTSSLAGEVVGTFIIRQWLERLATERPLPKIVDTLTGDSVMLVTDHYGVTDWEALGVILAAQPDVHGNRTEGWVRFARTAGNVRRSRAALNPKGDETLEVFCRTLKLADDARRWLEKIAGSTLTYKIREMVDPRSRKALESTPAVPRPNIPPEVATQIMHDYLRNVYDDWTEKPIPVLGNRTPRVAIKTAKGRREVIELLQTYELNDARRVRDEGGKPFDFGFLWERLGLKRE
jgi:hypothetical protein